MQRLLLCLVLCAVSALARSNPTPSPAQQYYTFTGQYSEGCVIGSGCKCAMVTYNMSGNFYLLTQPAGLVLQSFAFALVGTQRIIDGQGVLHQNNTIHAQVRLATVISYTFSPVI